MLYNIVLILPCMACLFWFIELLTDGGKRTQPRKYLIMIACMGTFSCFMLANYVSAYVSYPPSRWLHVLDCIFTINLFPAFYIYFNSTMSPGKIKRIYYLLFVPPTLLAIVLAALYASITQGQYEEVINGVRLGTMGIIEILHDPTKTMIFLLGVVGYHTLYLIYAPIGFIYAFSHYAKYSLKLKDMYANADAKASEVKAILMGAGCMAVCVVIYLIMQPPFWRGHPTLTTILFIFWAGVYFRGIQACASRESGVEQFRGDFNFIDKIHESREMEAIDIRQLGDKYGAMRSRLELLMKEKCLYLEKDLKATDVITALGTNKTYFAALMRDVYQTNFAGYISDLRIQYAKELMKQKPNMSMEELSEDCGFVSSSTFFRAFKERTGMTPKAWMSRKED